MTISISDRAVSPATTTGTPIDLLPFTVMVDDSDGPADMIDAMALAPFVTGTEPWARSKSLSRVHVDSDLRPESGALLRSATFGSTVAKLITGDGWTLRSIRWNNGNAQISVSATSDELATRILDEASSGAVTLPEPSTIPIGFWHRGLHRGVRTERTINLRPWSAIRANYNAAAAAVLDRLMAMTAADVRGRLLLLHGVPGTGKTTALRAGQRVAAVVPAGLRTRS